MEMFTPTGEMGGDSGRTARISAQIANLDTHCQLVERLWRDAWQREGGVEVGPRGRSRTGSKGSSSGRPTRRVGSSGRVEHSTAGESESGRRGDDSQARTSAKSSSVTISSPVDRTAAATTSSSGGGVTDSGKAKATGKVGRAVQKLTSPTTKLPPTSSQTSSTAHFLGATPSRTTKTGKHNNPAARARLSLIMWGVTLSAGESSKSSARRLSDMYGDLEAEAYKVRYIFTCNVYITVSII